MNDREYPSGVSGWLLFFVIGQCAVIPLADLLRGYQLVSSGTAEGLFMPMSDQTWLIAGLGLLVAAEVAIGAFVAHRLYHYRTPESVTWAIAGAWASFALLWTGYVAVWAISAGAPLMYTIDMIIFFIKARPIQAVLALGWAIGWTVYFNRSMRVEYTYFQGEDEPEIGDVFA